MRHQPSTRTILQQGKLDGFCLLYSILNAFAAVCPKELAETLQKDQSTLWARLISMTPSLQSFACYGSIFSELPNNDVDVAVKRLLTGQYAEVLSDWLKSKTNGSFERVSIEPVAIDTPKWHRAMVQVSIPSNKSYFACLKKKNGVLKYGTTNEHWVALVGSTIGEVAVSCSYTSHHLGQEYREWILSDGRDERFYNNVITEPLTSDHVFVKSRYELTIS